MVPIGPLATRRLPHPLRRQVDIAGAVAWEALVETHASHALQFIALLSDVLEFDVAADRYLDELDVRDPMASAVRSRVLIALEHALTEDPDRPVLPRSERVAVAREADRDAPAAEKAGRGHAADAEADTEADAEADTEAESRASTDPEQGLRRFRPDVLVSRIARRVREGSAHDQWVRLAVARAEEAVIRCHVDNALVFARLLLDHESLNDAVDDYLEFMRVAGSRGQSAHQRAMARLAEIHLPDDVEGDEARADGVQRDEVPRHSAQGDEAASGKRPGGEQGGEPGGGGVAG